MGFLSKLFGAKPARPKLIVEQRRWIMVYDVPTDAGWHRSDEERQGEDFVVQVLKLARTDDRLVLIAKDYTGAVGDEDLRARDWNAQYAQISATVTNVAITDGKQTLMDRVIDALDVVADPRAATATKMS